MTKISIITINYNNALGLEQTIKSVLAQQDCVFEFVIIDGASTDNSVEIIKQYIKPFIHWISEKDKGIYHAQNKGWQMASGEYCLFLNSGDVLVDKNVLSKVEKQLIDTDIVYGDLMMLNNNNQVVKLLSPDVIDVPHMMVSTLWHPSAFIKRNLLIKYGGYREDFKIAADYELFIRFILKHNVSYQHITLVIAQFDLKGVSNNEQIKSTREIERKQSWQVNFGNVVIELFEEYTRLLRSREYKMYGYIKKYISPIIK